MHLKRPIITFLLLACTVPARAAVTGRVIGSDGRPRSGATIAAFALEASSDRAARLASGRARMPVAKATAGADGSFRMDIAVAVVDIEVTASGSAPAFARLEDGEDATFPLTPADSVRGDVRAAGRLVAGATVVWMMETEAGEMHEVVRQSAADGGYDVPSPAAWASRVVVIHPDFAPFSSGPRSSGWESRLRHDLVEGVTVGGRVVDDGTERPIVGATIEVDGWPVGRSAEGGVFLIRHAPADWSRLVARTDALAGTTGPRTGRLTVRASPLRRLSGAVRDRRSGQPLAGATVTLYGGRGGGALSTATDASGRYVLGVPDGRYAAMVARPGFESALESGDDAEPLDLHRPVPMRRDFALSRLRRLSGRVQDEAGRPIDGALVWVSPSEAPRLYSRAKAHSSPMAWTVGGGRFALSLPATREGNEDWTVTALKPGYAMGVVEHLREASAVSPVVVDLPVGVEMAGRVMDPDGTPIPEVAVVVAESSGFVPLRYAVAGRGDVGWTRSGPDGRFTTRVRGTSHELMFLVQGRSPKLVRGYDPTGGAPLEVVLEPAAEIRGRVLNAVGPGVGGLQVVAWAPSLGRPASATTAGDGAFVLTELAPGSYLIQVLRDDEPVGAPRSAEAPASDLRIEIEPTGAIRGQVLDSRTRQPISRFHRIGGGPRRDLHARQRSARGRGTHRTRRRVSDETARALVRERRTRHAEAQPRARPRCHDPGAGDVRGGGAAR
jgi:hypothetical protein